MKKIMLVTLSFLICFSSFSQKKAASVSTIIHGKEAKGLISESGSLIIPVLYQYIVPDSNIYIVSKDGLWECLDKDGHVIIPIKYQDISAKLSGDIIRVKKNNKWGGEEKTKREIWRCCKSIGKSDHPNTL